VSSVDLTLVGDYDEPRRRVRLRAATTKTRKPLWVELHPLLADEIEARLGPREDHDPEARLFAGSGADALRTAIGKACKATGVPVFSPHDLRHRRTSLLHLQGMPWVRIADFVGQRDLTVTANTYTQVLVDEAEVDTRTCSDEIASCCTRAVLGRGIALFAAGFESNPGSSDAPGGSERRAVKPAAASLKNATHQDCAPTQLTEQPPPPTTAEQRIWSNLTGRASGTTRTPGLEKAVLEPWNSATTAFS
jgi:hypothetical protein